MVIHNPSSVYRFALRVTGGCRDNRVETTIWVMDKADKKSTSQNSLFWSRNDARLRQCATDQE